MRKEGPSTVQLNITHKSAPTATPEVESSGSEMDVEVVHDRSEEYGEDGEQPESSGVVADVPTLQKKVPKGKTGGRGGLKSTGKRTIDDRVMTSR